MGATIIDYDREKLDKYIKKSMGMVPVEDTPEKPANGSQCPSAKLMLYDYFFDRQQRLWIAWEWIVPEYIHDRKKEMSEILVPTVDTLYTSAMLGLMNTVRIILGLLFPL